MTHISLSPEYYHLVTVQEERKYLLVPYIIFFSANWWHLQCQDKILTLVPSRPFQSLSHSLVRKASARKIVKWVGASLKRKRVRSSLKKSVHKQRVRLSEGKSNSFTRLKPIRHEPEARGSRQRVLLTESAPRAREIGSDKGFDCRWNQNPL